VKLSLINCGSKRGQAAIAVLLATSILLLGALGFAIDGAQMYVQRQMAHAAADAAVEAGIMSILDGTNITSAYPFGTGATPIASSVCTTTDGRTPCVYARNNGFGGTASDTVTLSFPASISGVTLTSATVPALEVTVQRTLATGFIQMIAGPSALSVTASATAGLVGTVSPNSIYVLDPSAKNAFQVSGAATVTVNGGGIVINSSNSDAATISGSAQVNAGEIEVAGGVSITGAASTNPAPVTGIAQVADPFASLPALTPGSCATHPTNYSPPTGTTLQPGTYCGGISVGGVANVTFAAGDYIINGGGVTFGNSSVVTGSGVMFYLTGTNTTYGSFTASGATTVTLSAPTSGSYLGVLFFQDRSITSSNGASIGNSANVSLTGTLYFPTTAVSFSGAVGTSSTMAVVADQVSFSGSASIQHDSTGLKTGLFSTGAALVQ